MYNNAYRMNGGVHVGLGWFIMMIIIAILLIVGAFLGGWFGRHAYDVKKENTYSSGY